MATIIQPYDPWREKAAVNLIGGLLTNMIARNQQRADNRLNNRFLSDYSAITSPVTTNYLGAGNQEPVGNAWENTFRQGGNELVNFDMNTAGIAPRMTQQPQEQPFDKARMMRSALSLLGQGQYANLNTDQVMKFLNPYFEASEQARKEYLTRELSESLMGAPNSQERMKLLMGGMVRGDIAPEVYNNAFNSDFNLYKYNNLSAQQTADNDYRNRALLENIRQFDMNNANRRYEFDATLGQNANQFAQTMNFNREQNALNRADANTPKYTNTFVGQDGYMYQVDQFGNARPFMVNGEHMKAPQGWQGKPSDQIGWGKADDAVIAQFNKEYDELTTQQNALIEQRNNSENAAEKSQLNEQIRQIEGKKQQIHQNIYSFLNNRMSQGTNVQQAQHQAGVIKASNPVWHGMINGTRTSQYGNRGNRFHGGVDVAGKAGENIRVPDWGTTFTVKNIVNDPYNGYGNHVDLEGNINGHKVELKIAHMENGSIGLQKGQRVGAGAIIGRVGNTGRTTDKKKGGVTIWYPGKDSGYHMHLEMRVDGVRVNPENYHNLLGGAQQQTQQPQNINMTPFPNAGVNAPQNNSVQQPMQQSVQRPTQQPQQTNRQPVDDSPIEWTHSTQSGLTRNKYETLVRQAIAGEIQGIKSQAELDRALQEQGYTRVDKELGNEGYTKIIPKNQAPSYQQANLPFTGNNIQTDPADWRPSYQRGYFNTSPITDIINHTTDEDMQKSLDFLNGYGSITRNNSGFPSLLGSGFNIREL